MGPTLSFGYHTHFPASFTLFKMRLYSIAAAALMLVPALSTLVTADSGRALIRSGNETATRHHPNSTVTSRPHDSKNLTLSSAEGDGVDDCEGDGDDERNGGVANSTTSGANAFPSNSTGFNVTTAGADNGDGCEDNDSSDMSAAVSGSSPTISSAPTSGVPNVTAEDDDDCDESDEATPSSPDSTNEPAATDSTVSTTVASPVGAALYATATAEVSPALSSTLGVSSITTSASAAAIVAPAAGADGEIGTATTIYGTITVTQTPTTSGGGDSADAAAVTSPPDSADMSANPTNSTSPASGDTSDEQDDGDDDNGVGDSCGYPCWLMQSLLKPWCEDEEPTSTPTSTVTSLASMTASSTSSVVSIAWVSSDGTSTISSSNGNTTDASATSDEDDDDDCEDAGGMAGPPGTEQRCGDKSLPIDSQLADRH